MQADRAKQREVQRDNATLWLKLADIKREAPATFHAPNGYASLRVR